jgi:F-type H+-transporting ATPase subunit gamma
MATIREIKRRITAVKSTQKITRAMQMVAAAKLRRAQDNILRARPYAINLENIISEVAMRSKRDLHPLLSDPATDERYLLVVVTSDSGLCGAFNTNVIKAAVTFIDENPGKQVDIFAVGRKSRDFFRKTENGLTGEKVLFFNSLKYSDSVEIIAAVQQQFLEGGYDRVFVQYNEFKNAIQQNLTIKQLLPLIPAEPVEGTSTTDFIYEPDEYTVFDKLIPYHLEIQMWRILLESYAAEMGAKMTAMDSATVNAGDLLKTLSITYNRARQALITKELSEIVGGAEGLRG